jgi:hypothetical protein
MKDGGPAFPRTGSVSPIDLAPQSGMSLRDYFAAAALQALIALDYHDLDTPAERAYRYADRMLEEREKP